MPASAHYDTLIIGAGMSGLAAGIRLAHFGQRVAILERHSLWGGLNSFYKHNGRRLDVGLHALTNYAPKGARNLPLTRVLRQLRLKYDDLRLGEQSWSEIRFPGLSLSFSNDFARLESEVARAFPAEVDAFARLAREVREADAYAPLGSRAMARAVLRERFRDPLLVEALLLPVCYYGSARDNDVDWYQFVVLFRSLFLEGFARPAGGIKTLLDLLVGRFRELGGELRMNAGVERILVHEGRARGVRLADGSELRSERVISSAGFVETMRLCGAPVHDAHVRDSDRGRLSFLETIVVTDRAPRDFGFGAAVVFWNDAPELRYRVPDELVDVSSGVACSPNNYATDEPLRDGLVRVTVRARPEPWMSLAEPEYRARKQACAELALDAAARHVPDPRPFELDRDTFTPRTIRQYTGHDAGAVYGSPRKRIDGESGVAGLYLCGADQGLLGVVGALISGITMANRHALVPQAGEPS